jgi:hypothetical protein
MHVSVLQQSEWPFSVSDFWESSLSGNLLLQQMTLVGEDGF